MSGSLEPAMRSSSLGNGPRTDPGVLAPSGKPANYPKAGRGGREPSDPLAANQTPDEIHDHWFTLRCASGSQGSSARIGAGARLHITG